jgi:hypothetical protein
MEGRTRSQNGRQQTDGSRRRSDVGAEGDQDAGEAEDHTCLRVERVEVSELFVALTAHEVEDEFE